MLVSLNSYFRFCFRDIERYSSIFQEHTHAYSDRWHILIAKHIQTRRYIHNTILNSFTKAPSWTFDTVINVPLFYRCYLTSYCARILNMPESAEPKYTRMWEDTLRSRITVLNPPPLPPPPGYFFYGKILYYWHVQDLFSHVCSC